MPLVAGDWSDFFDGVLSFVFLGRPGPGFLAVAAEELGAAAAFAPGLNDLGLLAAGVPTPASDLMPQVSSARPGVPPSALPSLPSPADASILARRAKGAKN